MQFHMITHLLLQQPPFQVFFDNLEGFFYF